MANPPEKNNAELLQELEALSQTLYQSHNARRTAPLALQRSTNPNQADAPAATVEQYDQYGTFDGGRSESRLRTSRMSMSPWRSRPSPKRPQPNVRGGNGDDDRPTSSTTEERKGIWNWKPIRALSRIAMQKMGCLFSVDVVVVQDLPASMNGLRLSVIVRKKGTKEGVQTMPARVLEGVADFEETLFIRCNVHCSGGSGTGKPIKFEPRPFSISAVAIDAPELDFGGNTVDPSLLMKESVEKSLQGARVRHWDRSFKLVGKARGGELVVKLGFQILEDGGVGIYTEPIGRQTPTMSGGKQSPPTARKQSKSSFSITSPRTTRKAQLPTAPSKSATSTAHFKEIDDFKLDEPMPTAMPSSISAPPPVEAVKDEDHDFPDFDVVDKGVEIEDKIKLKMKDQRRQQQQQVQEEEVVKSASSDVVVKEVVVQRSEHWRRLRELDSIAKKLSALESTLRTAGGNDGLENNPDVLEADEETVKQEFLQLLELDDDKHSEFDTRNLSDTPESTSSADEFDESDGKFFVPELGQGLGAVVRTKDGGYLVSTNPFDVEVPRTETPKIAIQISKPLVLKDQKSCTGFELFQRMAAMGSRPLGSSLLSLTEMDELTGKTAGQIAFEGIASAIVSGRNRKGENSNAATLVAKLKNMSFSVTEGRKERILTGIWKAGDKPIDAEDLLSFTLQRIESMAVEALKIQADMAEEDAPFDVPPLAGGDDPNPPLSSAVQLEEWTETERSTAARDLTALMVVQMRDTVQRNEKVGAPMVAMVQAAWAGKGKDGRQRYKVGSAHLGGMTTKSGGGGEWWGGEKERLTAMQWLAASGFGKKGRVARGAGVGGGRSESLWSMSSRIMADMWLKPVRNPDVRFC